MYEDMTRIKRTTRDERPYYYPHRSARSKVYVQRVDDLFEYQRYLDVQQLAQIVC